MLGPAITTTSYNTSKDISPLELPETLSRILSYVDQTTLRNSAVLVSHLWLVTCRHRLVRELTWEECFTYRGGTGILERLPYASRLCLVINGQISRSVASSTAKALITLMQALKDIQERQVVSPAAHNGQGATQGATQGAKNNRLSPVCAKDPLVLVPRTLQELVLIVRADGLDRFIMLAPYLSTLTDLRLRQFHSGTIHVGLVAQTCPHLRVLHLAAHYTLNLSAPWHDPPLDSYNIATTTIDDHPPSIVPLTTLVLENARFIQEEFEQFLFTTPHLQVLKLIKLQKLGEPGTIAGQIQYDCSRLYNHIQELNLQLQTFHFSVDRDAAANAAFEEMMVAGKMGNNGSSTEWNFAAEKSPTPRLIQHIRQFSNVVTSLTFHNVINSHHEAMPLLHQYLCNSSHLIHLWASRTYYPIAHMDLFQRIPEPVNPLKTYNRAHTLAEIKSFRPGVWKCRNLETLHIGFQISGGWGTRHQPEQSRVVFGYIARVLPQLRDLQIHTHNGDQVFPLQKLRLSGGFCLLAKLQYLERLKICNGRSPQPPKHVYDIDWMVREGWTTEAKEARRRAMAPWGQPTRFEEEVEVMRIAKSLNRAGGGVGDIDRAMQWELSVDPELREALQHLGQLLDVKLWLDEMVAPEDGLSNQWPSLQKIAIASSAVYGLSPLREFYRLTSAGKCSRGGNERQ